MKSLITLLIATCITVSASAQFKLSGRVAGLHKRDTLYMNIPFVYGFYSENYAVIPTDENGAFSITLPIKEQKFGALIYNNMSVTTLMRPGKSLQVIVNPGDGSFSGFKGTAANENELLYKLKTNSIPFFLKDDSNTNPYAKLSLTQLDQKLVKPWMQLRDEKISLIQRSPLSAADKKLLTSEVKSEAVVQLNYFARGVMDRTDKKRIDSLLLNVYKSASPVPDVDEPGVQFYYFADSYLSYMETLAFMDYQSTGDKNKPVKYFNLSFNQLNQLVAEKGKKYISWQMAKSNFTKPLAEAYLAQLIAQKYHDKDLGQATWLMQEYEASFPAGKHKEAVKQMMSSLTTMLAANANNVDIKVIDGQEKMTSIYQAISQLKGKVVYLDIWGTWCPPCREELRFSPRLKAHFKDKDVVFLYLDRDEDNTDASWRDFIKVNGMTGYHIRKNKADIIKFWAELMPNGENEQRYPTYFIFDKNGKLVQPDAKRPSDGSELYKQIEQYL